MPITTMLPASSSSPPSHWGCPSTRHARCVGVAPLGSWPCSRGGQPSPALLVLQPCCPALKTLSEDGFPPSSKLPKPPKPPNSPNPPNPPNTPNPKPSKPQTLQALQTPNPMFFWVDFDCSLPAKHHTAERGQDVRGGPGPASQRR